MPPSVSAWPGWSCWCGQLFAIASVVDVRARTCDTRIEVTRLSDGDTFTEHHRQYFFSDAQVQGVLAAAGSGLATFGFLTRKKLQVQY